MSDEIKNTFTSYLGTDFQEKLIWQLLIEEEFASKVLFNLSVEYFDDPNIKRLFIVILEFFSDYEKPPSLLNNSIEMAINKFGSTSNVEQQILTSIIKKIKLFNDRVYRGEIPYDGDIIRQETNTFIKQQEYRKLGEFIIKKIKTGEIKDDKFVYNIEDKINSIQEIGADDDWGTEIDEGIDHALRREFRQTIPTGVIAVDEVTGGGLGKGEIGVILAASGVGKSTILTRIANTAYEDEKNVLQVVFEDSEDQIKRKHYTIWSKIRLSEIDDRREEVKERVVNHLNGHKTKNKLIIKRFSQDGTTLTDIKNYMLMYEKRFGIKFDILVLDYLDCLEPHRRVKDPLEGELVIIKGFEAMAAEMNIPMWSATQSNRSGFDAEFLNANQIGGNIKKIQKSHFFMSIAKTVDQKDAQLANIRILKARFAQDGQTFENCIFNNDTMEIRITDAKIYRKKKLTVTQTVDEINQEEPNTIINHAELAEKFAEHNKDNSPTVGDITHDTKEYDDFFKKHTDNELIDDKTGDLSNIDDIKVNQHLNTNKSEITELLEKMRNEQGNVKKD